MFATGKWYKGRRCARALSRSDVNCVSEIYMQAVKKGGGEAMST